MAAKNYLQHNSLYKSIGDSYYKLFNLTTMELHDLPDDVIELIFKDLPKWSLVRFLKSKRYQKIACRLYYREIFIGKHTKLPSILSETHDPVLPGDFVFPGNKSSLSMPRFVDVQSFLTFYKTHPLFVPHTIHCRDVDILQRLSENNVLRDFKCLEFEGSLESGNFPKDISILPDQVQFITQTPTVYTAREGFQDTGNYSHVSELPVGFLGVSDSSVTESSLQGMPNLIELKAHNCFIGPLDLSFLENLTTLNLDIGKVSVSNSIESRDQYNLVLPSNVEYLTLTNVNINSVIDGLQSLAKVKQFTISFPQLVNRGAIKFPFPPNYKDLNIISPYGAVAAAEPGLGLDFETVPLSPYVKNLSMRGKYIVSSKFHFPITLEQLDLKHSSFNKLDVSYLTNLKHFHIQCIYKCKLPLSLEYLDADQTILNESESYTSKQSSLKFVKQNFPNCDFIRADIPDSVESLEWQGQYLSGFQSRNLKSMRFTSLKLYDPMPVVGNLQKLDFDAVECYDFSWLPKTVKKMTLKNSTIWDSFTCGPNMKFLALEKMVLKGSLEITQDLEILYLDGTHCEISDVLENAGVCLTTVHLANSIVGTLTADLTKTNLRHFAVRSCEFLQGTIKLPQVLMTYDVGYKKISTGTQS